MARRTSGALAPPRSAISRRSGETGRRRDLDAAVDERLNRAEPADPVRDGASRDRYEALQDRQHAARDRAAAAEDRAAARDDRGRHEDRDDDRRRIG